MHDLWIIEGYTGDFDQFEKDFNNKLYANGKARLRFREARLYTFAINEAGRDEFRADMKSLMTRIWDDTGGDNFQWHKMIGWAKHMLRFIGLKDIDFSNVKNSGIKGERSEGKVSYKLHFVPLGTVADARNKDDNSELV